MPPAHDLLRLLRDVRHRLDGDVSLGRIASRAGWSPFHLHRAFHRGVGETPKRYTLRLRLESAATRLVTTDDRILDIALAHGFLSHEVFTRAFRRHFGVTPARYRASALDGVPQEHRVRHATLVAGAGPCVHLFHYPTQPITRSSTMPTLSMIRKEIPAQPILSGAPWESYVTDPADHPDPADWRTEVYWPLA